MFDWVTFVDEDF